MRAAELARQGNLAGLAHTHILGPQFTSDPVYGFCAVIYVEGRWCIEVLRVLKMERSMRSSQWDRTPCPCPDKLESVKKNDTKGPFEPTYECEFIHSSQIFTT